MTAIFLPLGIGIAIAFLLALIVLAGVIVWLMVAIPRFIIRDWRENRPRRAAIRKAMLVRSAVARAQFRARAAMRREAQRRWMVAHHFPSGLAWFLTRPRVARAEAPTSPAQP